MYIINDLVIGIFGIVIVLVGSFYALFMITD